jgi:hypothetical protein
MMGIPFNVDSLPEFRAFNKLPRLNREIVITEKIDGTNAQIFINDDLEVFAGSRNRWLTLQDDNFGFAQWVDRNATELRAMGPGRHFGEWWGLGIQRGYALTERKFSLFNTERWATPPSCCSVVPVLYKGPFDQVMINQCLTFLKNSGSQASPGFMRPEGACVYHTAANIAFKVSLENDDKPKGQQ